MSFQHNDPKIIAILSELDLAEKEIEMYLMLLKTGTAPGSALCKRTGFTRSTTQYVCQQLVKKGLATMAHKNNSYLFTPEPPERLLTLLEKQRAALVEKEKRVQSIMGPLKETMGVNTALPRVQFYEGDGMIQLYDSILDMRAPIDSFEEGSRIFEMFPEYAVEFAEKRVKRKIPNRCIVPQGSRLNVTDPARYIQVRSIPADRYPFTWQVRICGDLVAIFSFEESTAVGISIRHQDIHRNFRLLFDYVWSTLPPT